MFLSSSTVQNLGELQPEVLKAKIRRRNCRGGAAIAEAVITTRHVRIRAGDGSRAQAVCRDRPRSLKKKVAIITSKTNMGDSAAEQTKKHPRSWAEPGRGPSRRTSFRYIDFAPQLLNMNSLGLLKRSHRICYIAMPA